MKNSIGRIRAVVPGALVVLLAAAAVGCGSSGDTTSSGAASTSTAGTAAPNSGKAGTKNPVKLAFVSDTVPGADLYGQIGAGAKGAADYINNELGGFGGRPVDLFSCDGKLDPAATTSCANQALAKGDIAMFGLGINWGTHGLPLFTKAGVPSFNQPNLPQDFTSKTTVGLQAAGTPEFTAGARFLCSTGAKKVVVMQTDVATAKSNYQFANKVFKDCGIDKSETPIPPTASDYSSFAQQAAAKKPDWIVVNFGQGPVLQIRKALAAAGFPADKTMGTSGSTDVKFLKQSGALVNGMYFTLPFSANPSDPEYKLYLQKMAQYVPGTNAETQLVEWGFSNLMTIRNAAEKIGFDKVDAKSLLTYFTSGQAKGLPVFLAKDIVATPPSEIPSLYANWTKIAQWKDGSYKDVVKDNGSWIQPFQG